MLYHTLEVWYEALRLVVTSWEEAEDLAVSFLRMERADNHCAGGCEYAPAPSATKSLVAAFFGGLPTHFPRADNLCEVLLEKFHGPAEFRGIVFVQQRVSAHVVAHMIKTDKRLSP